VFIVLCNSVRMCCAEVAEFCDEDGVRFSMEDSRRRFPGGIVGSLHFGWKSRNNHFVSYNDLVTKGEECALCSYMQFVIVLLLHRGVIAVRFHMLMETCRLCG